MRLAHVTDPWQPMTSFLTQTALPSRDLVGGLVSDLDHRRAGLDLELVEHACGK